MGGLMGWVVEEQGWRKGPWTPEEDKLLSQYVTMHGEGRWSSVSRCAGLNRSGKSCRLRWVNYLRPGLKRGQITPQEEGIIIELHALWGNKWSTIARYLPGRTDNEIKNYWRTHFKKKERSTRKSSERRKPHSTKIKPKQQEEQEVEQLPPIIITSTSEQMNQVIPTTQNIINPNNPNIIKQDLTFMNPNTTIDDPNLIISTPSSTSWMDDSLFWGGLWSFGDQLAMQQDQLCSKMAISSLQNQATNITNNITNNNNNIISANNNGLFWGEDSSNNFYRTSDQSYIF
ncbi:hypothetical protein vseg_002303 [Gypsophila vaccaria]